MKTSYLPHLDGIRALALAGVFLFHFNVTPFTGGYVGVDVFLTLSGYLVSRNIGIALHSERGFCLRDFYVRRFFRLYPTLLFSTCGSCVLAVAIFPSEIVLPTLKSAWASILFVSNFYFYFTTGYFDLNNRLKPLLHHWSLSLEMQYYLVWPPLLLLIVKRVPHIQHRIISGGVLTFASFLLTVTIAHFLPSFTFFMLPTRFFQFASGSLYAIMHWPGSMQMICTGLSSSMKSLPYSSSFASVMLPPSLGKVVRQILPVLSFSVIVSSYIDLSSKASPMQVAPVTLATISLIASQNTLFAKHVLSNIFPVWIGRISYPAYLVHWPIHVFLSYIASALNLSQPSAIMCTMLTFMCSRMLQYNIEQPLRRPRLKHRLLMLVLTIFTIEICRRGIYENGFSCRMQEYKNTGLPMSVTGNDKLFQGYKDMTKQMTNRTYGGVDRVGAVRTGERANYVFIGDSFTEHLRKGLNAVGKMRNVWFQTHFMPGCPVWTLDYYSRTKREYPNCYKHIWYIWREISMLPHGSKIMLANRWCDEPVEAFKKQVNEISNMVWMLGGHMLVVVGEPPGLSLQAMKYFPCAVFWQLPIGRVLALLARQLSAGKIKIRPDGTACADIRKGLQPRRCQSKQAVEKRDHMRGAGNIGFVDVWSELCGEEMRNWSSDAVCKLPVYFEDEQLYNVGYTMDGFHLSQSGSYYIGVNVLQKFMFGDEVRM